jgi:hypothetical protein
MKSQLKRKLKFLFLITVSIIIHSCSEKPSKETELTVNNDAITIPPSGQGGQPGWNYCSTCGISYDPYFACVDEDGAGVTCKSIEGDCGKEELIIKAAEYELNDSLPSSQIAYNYRDSVMTNFERGRRYTNFYYRISRVMVKKSTLNINNIVQHFNFAKDVFTVAQVLFYGDLNDIPISTGFKNDALALINYYRNIETESSFQDVLNEIEGDLNSYCGKTNTYIYEQLDN